MNDTEWRVIIRLDAEASTPADQAVTIVRMNPNDITATAIPKIVSSVLSLWRSPFFRTSLMMNMRRPRW